MKAKANAHTNEQYSRRNNIRIFGLPEEDGEDCFQKVLYLCENDLKINVKREDLDRVHRVGRPKESQGGIENPSPRAMIVKVIGHGIKMKIMKACRTLKGKNIFIKKI